MSFIINLIYRQMKKTMSNFLKNILGSINNVKQSNVVINGKTYFGDTVVITKDDIIIDGNSISNSDRIINIQISGDVEKIDFVNVNSFVMNGNAGLANTTNGDINVDGNILGSVNTINGNVNANDIGGSVGTISGDIKIRSDKRK